MSKSPWSLTISEFALLAAYWVPTIYVAGELSGHFMIEIAGWHIRGSSAASCLGLVNGVLFFVGACGMAQTERNARWPSDIATIPAILSTIVSLLFYFAVLPTQN